tara:strand:+ start:62 stop:289 length:228 start_codon:yes stop_codon:yes gene_type:complete
MKRPNNEILESLETTSGYEMTYAVGLRLMEIQNGLIPKLGCGYFSYENEEALKDASFHMGEALRICLEQVRANNE